VPRSRQISDNELPRYRLAVSDVAWALFLIGWMALAVVAMLRDIDAYRWQKQMRAEFEARTPQMVGAAPYDPAIGQRLIGEAAGFIVTIAVAWIGIRRRRRGAFEVRVKWVSAPETRVAAVQPANSLAATSNVAVLPSVKPTRKEKPGSLAADRLSVILWNDHVARLENRRA
jgi:hypothetical protein